MNDGHVTERNEGYDVEIEGHDGTWRIWGSLSGYESEEDAEKTRVHCVTEYRHDHEAWAASRLRRIFTSEPDVVGRTRITHRISYDLMWPGEAKP